MIAKRCVGEKPFFKMKIAKDESKNYLVRVYQEISVSTILIALDVL